MKETKIYMELKKKDDDQVDALVTLVNEIFEDCTQIHKTIVKSMPDYTLHDEIHLQKIIELMDRLIPPSTLQNLSPLELAGLILSAALHDIGMAPSQEKVAALLRHPATSQNNRRTDPESVSYHAFRESHASVVRRQKELHSQERHFEAQELEAYLLSQYLRETHGERVRQLIFEKYGQKLVYADFNFTSRLAEICCSHTKDPLSLRKLPCYELVRAPGEYVNWRFIAIILRLADILDFDGKRTPSVLFEHLGIRDKISIREWNKHRSVKAWDIRPGRIAFSAKCPDPVIEKCVRDFIKEIDDEISFAREILSGMHDPACEDMEKRYHLDLPPYVDTRNIGPEEGPDGTIYKYMDLGFHLDEESIISLVMGVNLYGDPLLFLRELLQNAVDTCRHRKALEEADGNFSYVPEIIVKLYKNNKKWFLSIEDNGMGMDEEIVSEHFARIGKSYYRSGRFLREKAKKSINFQPISKFGIGILSVFMVADQLKVETRKLKDNLHDLDTPLDIEINGPAGLFWFRKSDRTRPGTRLVLSLGKSPSFLGENPNTSLIKIVRQIVPHLEFPISVYEEEKKYELKGSWKLSPLINPEYAEFCRQVTIDLTSEGPKGLEGLIRILLLQDSDGKLSTEVELEECCEAEDGIIYDKLVQLDGSIYLAYTDYSEREGVIEEETTEFSSGGRLSIGGFSVSEKLFGGCFGRGKSRIWYPFVVHYDLDLSGDFTVNLTVDRLRIVSDEKSHKVARRICEVISTLLLEKLGKDEVKKGRKFFYEAGKTNLNREIGEILKSCLDNFLVE